MTVLLAHVHRDGSDAVFDAAVQQASFHQAPLVILNVAPGEAPVDDRIAPADELDDLVRRAGDQGVTATVEQPVGGDVPGLIVEHAEKHGADLVVIGVRRRSAVGKLLMGSVSQKVLLESEVPVLAVK